MPMWFQNVIQHDWYIVLDKILRKEKRNQVHIAIIILKTEQQNEVNGLKVARID